VISKNSAVNAAAAEWSLPWHALLRTLASGVGADLPGHSALFIKPMNVQSVAVSANTWLQRAHFRASIQARP
jgi:hypothetical protein